MFTLHKHIDRCCLNMTARLDRLFSSVQLGVDIDVVTWPVTNDGVLAIDLTGVEETGHADGGASDSLGITDGDGRWVLELLDKQVGVGLDHG
ncbi:hypothetical protein SAMD00019534_040130 [Acytostelium subglobosum LB1]|uniref:hypothetical protein n=1 Tax=Acytostelium subglobosum LB1 TaxID=1410327 RepID=UPI00064506E9|nr:hypothetical protein SAMD00019534_040130 [Acytostelium subglobosum LB1]GAM20837.1 hypothetical protein SAMD00019534_040130 [Acytostelium subglobosum LB1]|eukprot:XP_012755971.1 hypothetical protein SAMD00019534_040130 [Acytostelium subglobosum LB1]